MTIIKGRYLTVALIFITLQLQAQEIKFGKVSMEELTEKYNSKDSLSDATYLYKYRKTYFMYSKDKGFELVTEFHNRLKIYSKEGFDYATKKINLYKEGSSKEKVSGLKGVTYNLHEGEIVESKLRKDGEFEIELSRYHDQKSFTMPNVKEGSVIEYQYSVLSPFISNIDEFILQEDIPIKKTVAIMESPEYFNFRLNTKGFLLIKSDKRTVTDKISFLNKTRSGGQGFSSRNTDFSTSVVSFNKEIATYELSDVPALKEEPFVNNIDNYRSAIKYELSYTKFPNGGLKYYATTWEDVVKKIYDHPNFGTELNKKGYYDDDLETIISGVSKPLDRMELIFDFVKSQIKWNGLYGKYATDGVKKAYKDRTGNVAELNLILTSMLRNAGLKADPVLISTRSHGIPLFPTREGYNYVVSGVETSNGMVLLDATSPFNAPNMIPVRALNWEGRVIAENGTSRSISLIPSKKSTDTAMIEVVINDDGSVDGEFRQQYRGHYAMIFRSKFNKVTQDAFLEQEEKVNDDIEISDYKLTNNSEIGKPIVQFYNFFKEDVVDVVANKLYFSPMLHLASEESPFKLEKREFPVDFGFPWEDKFIIKIKIPEGYQVETLPESKIISLPENLGLFRYVIKNNSQEIDLTASVSINSGIIPPNYYDTLKEFYRQLVEKETEKVVLSKITGDEYTESATGSR
ncbi:DUF3857 domain-containing protein [Kriegella aquimaris]|uniref:DUF3857 domain-containing protein n=1 Tax=Kriegella aquimaris TaxID=192904 RepID=A0A1G9PSP5_9FLAO|nr:DUF3857 domain-containing protein [Kriegella aquimaris]SDM01257.1 protein of unknown function [Kriegella aquimaris]